MKKVLFVTTKYRTGEKVYPIIPRLSEICSVDILNLLEMSPFTNWIWSIDPRNKFYDQCRELGLNIINGPGESSDKNKTERKYSEFIGDKNLNYILGRDKYDLVVCDNNSHIKGLRLGPLYQWVASQNIPFLASPHGNKEYKAYKAMKRIGKLYDYTFVFGEKEKKKMAEAEKKYIRNLDRLFPAGIPCNDRLIDYTIRNEYILIITNFTEAPPADGITGSQKPFTKETFDCLKIDELSKKYGCPIVIKEKYRLFYEDDSLRKALKGRDDVEFKMVVEDDNELVCGAKIVITAPSTMAFKPIQRGIPTVVIRGQGMLGNFEDFVGTINADYEEMMKALDLQFDKGRQEDFIRSTLSGGVEYNSIQCYIDYIQKFLDGEIK